MVSVTLIQIKCVNWSPMAMAAVTGHHWELSQVIVFIVPVSPDHTDTDCVCAKHNQEIDQTLHASSKAYQSAM